MNLIPTHLPLSQKMFYFLLLLSFLIVAFGQPVWAVWPGMIAASLGYALFWRVLLAFPSALKRFCVATVWFFGVQLVQLFWFTSHPYIYIYAVYLFLALGVGVQFGLLGIFIQPASFKKIRYLFAIAALWTIMEWSRNFALSGFSWNPTGLTLSGNLYSRQLAALGGIFGLSFWVMSVNLLLVRAFITPTAKSKKLALGLWAAALLLPYIYGFAHLQLTRSETNKTLRTLLVQTAFPTEESKDSSQRKNPIVEATDEWRQILTIAKKFEGKSFNLMVLPEFVVPFGTYAFAYPLNKVIEAFHDLLGPDSLKTLPSIEFPYSVFQSSPQGPQLMVNNAYWVQGLANFFKTDLLIGLEDADDVSPGNREYYSAALLFHPSPTFEDFPERYAKQVLVPMGEYIPFAFCRELAKRYGVLGSFTAGKESKVMMSHGISFSPSICYEETFGNIIREGRQFGAELLVNITSDTWYPNSQLPRQHFDHARLRSVENGVSLIRACNTGITCAIDSHGEIIAMLGGDTPEAVEWTPDALLVDVPIETYPTLYSRYGDRLIIGLCLLIILFSTLELIWNLNTPNKDH